MNVDTISSIERQVLIEVGKRVAEFDTRTPPPAWKTWALQEYEEIRDYGPRYSPADWFGGGQGIPEKYRVRYLRAVYSLRDRGLIVTAGVNRRLTNVKLTEAGRAALKELAPPTQTKPKKAERKRRTAADAGDGKPVPVSPPDSEAAPPGSPPVDGDSLTSEV